MNLRHVNRDQYWRLARVRDLFAQVGQRRRFAAFGVRLARAWVLSALCVGVLATLAPGAGVQGQLVDEEDIALMKQFDDEVDRRLDVLEVEQRRYIERLQAALRDGGVVLAAKQHLILVDRSAQVQAIAVLLFDPPARWFWIGASATSTGRPGQFDHFVTPSAVFVHSLANPDFRSEGTLNENHIRGYGVRGMRVFDFGWVIGERGWGGGGMSAMRLQMHASDPTVLEPRLGTAQSKGCIRIAASLNRYLDHHAILDADYEQASRKVKPFGC